MRPERAAPRQRLVMENVERGTRKLPRIQRRQDVGLVLQAAAARIDERGAVRQPIEQGLVEHAFGVVRQWQETDENLGALQEILQPLRTDRKSTRLNSSH